jgi:hypothetical protein
MERTIRTKIGMWMFTVLAVVFGAVDARGGLIHLHTEGWGSSHAHMVTGLFYTLALCAVVIILTWIPFRRGEQWAWWTIAMVAVTIHGGHLLGDALTEGGLRGGGTAQGPGMVFYSLTGLALLLYVVALLLSWRHVADGGAAPEVASPGRTS